MKTLKKITAMVVVGGVLYSVVEPFRYIVKKYEIKHKKIPTSFDGYKIVFLADVHYGRATQERYLKKVVERVNSLKPDLVVLGGDYVTSRLHFRSCFDLLGQIEAKDGIYGVMGNHDVVESEQEAAYYMKRNGIKNITNDAVWIGERDKIKLGGVGDLWTQSQHIEPFMNDMKDEDYGVLLTHNPKYINYIEEIEKVGLILGGHTHGGQIKAVKYLDKVATQKISHKVGLEYLSGKYNKGETDIVVSNGIGTAMFPLRFMAPPEIIVLSLKAE